MTAGLFVLTDWYGERSVFFRLDFCGFTCSAAHVVEFRSPDVAFSDDFDLFYPWRMYRERLFDAYAGSDPSDCESLTDAAALLLENESLEHLDSFPVAFFDLDINFYLVARFKIRYVLLQIILRYCVQCVHNMRFLLYFLGVLAAACLQRTTRNDLKKYITACSAVQVFFKLSDVSCRRRP